MSAVVVPAHKTVMFENALTEFRIVAAKKKAFHFREARHPERIAFLRALRGWPFAVITVATHKPSVKKDSSVAEEARSF